MKGIKTILYYRVHHLVIWLSVYFVWYYLRVDDYPNSALASQITLLKVADLALLVYLTNYLLIPQLLYRKRYVLFSLVYLGMILISSYVKMKIIGQLLNNPGPFDLRLHWRDRIYDNLLPHIFLVTAGATVKLVMDYIRQQKRLADLAKENAVAELNFLKSQINPHFLFNSINSVYFLIDKENKEAREALHKFSTMLRYQLYETDGDRIPIEKEIGFLKDYVDLQKLRREEGYEVEFEQGEGLTGFSIEPLILIPFVENAFKHISHHGQSPNFIHILASRQNGNLNFSVTNSFEVKSAGKEPYSGIGLQNVKRRLELLYPGQHVLDISQHDGIYKMNLSLPVKTKLTAHESSN